MPFYDSPRTPDEVQQIPDSILNFYCNGLNLQEIMRTDIFPSDSLLIEALKNAIQNRRDLILNCNSPSFYSDIIKNKWHISPSGAVFYVLNGRGWFNQITIPKDVILKEHLISSRYSDLFN
jgi:hypothetical protein